MIQVIRCPAGVGGQGKPSGDGEPVGRDRPLEKGDGGINKASSGPTGDGGNMSSGARLRT